MLLLILAFVFLLVYVCMPLMIAVSWKIGAVDVPADTRRMHMEKIPRGGGMAIFLGLIVGCVMYGKSTSLLNAALWGGALMLVVGLADDIFCLSAVAKLCLQISSAVTAVLGSGMFHTAFENAMGIFWVLLLTNAHNFIDGMDGLLAGCGGIEALLLAGTLFLSGNDGLWQVSLILAVSLFSFRVYNKYPAQIFAGDCGSETVGFLLAMLSLPLFSSPAISFLNVAPLLLFAYPITDLLTSVLRRLLRGGSPFRADRGHLHHRLYAKGLHTKECVALLLCISASLGGIGMFLSTTALWTYACLSCVGTFFLLCYLRKYLFGTA